MNQAHPIELRGSFLGIVVGEYQHSNDHRELVRARELAALLEGFGYHPTVLENPTIDELRTGLREWVGSKDFFAAHVEELLAPPATIALEEMRLLVSPRADQHQLLLEDIRERGIDAAYRPLLLRDRISPSPRR